MVVSVFLEFSYGRNGFSRFGRIVLGSFWLRGFLFGFGVLVGFIVITSLFLVLIRRRFYGDVGR